MKPDSSSKHWKSEVILTLTLTWCSNVGSGLQSSPLLPSSQLLMHQGGHRYDIDHSQHDVSSFSPLSTAILTAWLRHTDTLREQTAASRPTISILDHERWLPASQSAMTSTQFQLATATTPSSTSITTTTAAISPPNDASISPSATATSTTTTWRNDILHTPNYKLDKIERIIDASTLRLQKSGIVTLQSVRGAGTTYKLPDCMTYSPSHKLKLLLPRGTVVRLVNLEDVRVVDTSAGMSSSSSSSGLKQSLPSSTTTTRLWIVRESDKLLINEELVRTGFAYVRGGGSGSAGASNNVNSLPDNVMHDLIEIEQYARKRGLGIFQSCDENTHVGDDEVGGGGRGDTLVMSNANNNNFVAEFEPMEYTTEIQYGDDGGKYVLRRGDGTTTTTSSQLPPENPGDIKGCSDFRTYEDALRWYEAYLPYYGDVAKLDRDGDGVPCPGLPHTTLREQYRMKKRVL